MMARRQYNNVREFNGFAAGSAARAWAGAVLGGEAG
jgi:hypothetical protein